MRNIFTPRSLLYVPGDKQYMIAKVSDLLCDAVIFDLEDAISPVNKELARNTVCEELSKAKIKNRNVFLRINGADTEYLTADLQASVRQSVDGVILPKADVFAVRHVEEQLSQIEQEENKQVGKVKMIPLIETAFGIESVGEIVRASDRIIAAQLGAEDLTKDLGIKRTKEGDEIQYARNRFVFACRAFGKEAIDTPYTDIKDLDGLRRDALAAKNMGMTGKTCIHPLHIEIINSVFSPSQEEISNAQKIVEYSLLRFF